MAFKITDEIIKEYTERNGLPEVYEAFKEVKSDKDLKKFMRDKLNKRTVEAIETEMKQGKRREALQKLREDDPYTEGMTDEEIVESSPESFVDIDDEKAEIQFGIPSDLFKPKGEMSNREWIAMEREVFKRAGLDFDNMEDRQRAAEAQSIAAQKQELQAEKEARGLKEGLKEEVTTPRTSGKYYAGEPVTTSDVVSDVLRVGEAAPPVVALPAMAVRNVLDVATDDDVSVKDLPANLGADIGSYIIGGGGLSRAMGQGGRIIKGGLRQYLGGQKLGEKTLQNITKGTGEGSRRQVVEATKKALTGGMANPAVNPYAEDAVKEVARAGLSEGERKQAVKVLDKYLLGGDKEVVEKASETLKTSKKIGKGFEKEVQAEAKKMGQEALETTTTQKLSFDEVSRGLSEKDAGDLLRKLQSQGLRDVEGRESFVGVSGVKTSNPDEYRIARESEEIEKWFRTHKKAANAFKGEQAAKKVLSTIGTRPSEARGLLKYVAEAPVAYERPLSREGAKTAARYAPKALTRYLLPQVPEITGTVWPEEEK